MLPYAIVTVYWCDLVLCCIAMAIYTGIRFRNYILVRCLICSVPLCISTALYPPRNYNSIEVGIVSKADGKFRVLTPAEVQDYLDEAT